MGQVKSAELKRSTFQLSLQFNEVVESYGDAEAIGTMAVKFRDKRVSVSRPSKVFWVGVLLKKHGWIHTGVGLHNDITVTLENGVIKQYDYLVAHGVAGSNDRFQVYLTFANYLSDIYNSLAKAFDSEVEESFPPVFAGDSWTTNRIASDCVTQIERFLGLTFNMSSPGEDETNCVHFSVATYLFFAYKGDSELTTLLGKVGYLIRKKDYPALLTKIKYELNQVSAV